MVMIIKIKLNLGPSENSNKVIPKLILTFSYMTEVSKEGLSHHQNLISEVRKVNFGFGFEMKEE